MARNVDTEKFFDGTADGVFLLLRCVPAGHFNRPQASVCSNCGATQLEEVPAAGPARLVSWAVVPDRPRDGQVAGPPNIPAIVEFEEGPWWWTKLVGADPASLRAGQPLQLRFDRPDAGEAVPVFTPAEGGGA